jgi:hypothetical protein
VEDRHLDGRARFALACGIASLLVVFASSELGIFFGAFALIFAGASVIAVEDPPGPRTRRVALVAGFLTLPSLVILVILILTAGRPGD